MKYKSNALKHLNPKPVPEFTQAEIDESLLVEDLSENIWILSNHCTNDSSGEFTIRLQTHDFKTVLIGRDALDELEIIFSVPNSPIVTFREKL